MRLQTGIDLGIGLGGKIIDHKKPFEAKCGPKAGLGKMPVIIGQFRPINFN